MLEVPCAAEGSGEGIMQLHGAPEGGTVPLNRTIPETPITMNTTDRARNSESKTHAFRLSYILKRFQDAINSAELRVSRLDPPR